MKIRAFRALLLVPLLLAALLLVARPAAAQWGPPQLVTRAEPDEVEVNEPFTVQLQATVESGAPGLSDSRLASATGFAVGNPSTSTQTQVSIVNGRMTQRSGLSITWRVVGAKEGTFTLPGPTVAWNGARIAGAGVHVVVRPRGSLPRGARGRRPDPFDPFGMLPGIQGMLDPQAAVEMPQAQGTDPELSLDAAPDANVFLRAVASRPTAVVGEQITLTIYLYARRGAIELTDNHDASAPDFFKRDMMQGNPAPDARSVMVGGAVWRAQPIVEWALFPLRAGDLEVGPMRVTVLGAGHGAGVRGGLVRQTLPVHVQVSEPPATGRPPGYQVGDVGSFSLVSTVEPRAAEVGGGVAVTVTVSGTGNVPSTLRVPMQSGVEWLDPQTRESFDVQGAKMHGSRTFTYLVRPKTAGTIDLGILSLPYWDPDKRAYQIAAARLGTIQVSPGTPAATAPVVVRDPFAAVAGARTALGAFRPPAAPITDGPWFWLLLLGAPSSVVLAQLGVGWARALGARAALRRGSAASAIDDAIAEASRSNEPATVAAAVDRAVHLSIEAATGVRSRGLLLEELPGALEARGIAADLARRVRDLLASIDAVRFTPAEAPALGALVEEARRTSRELGRHTPLERAS